MKILTKEITNTATRSFSLDNSPLIRTELCQLRKERFVVKILFNERILNKK